MKKVPKHLSWHEHYKQALKDPEYRALEEKAGDRLEVAYSIVVMRHRAKMSQKEVARKLKVSQALIARIEQGGQNLTLESLYKIAGLFGKKVKIDFV